MYLNKSISVVIPCYNEEEGIARTIEGLPDFIDEILVVDNNCTDRTVEVAKAMGAKVIFQPEQGYGNAYKKGIPAARGEIIVTMDGDASYPGNEIKKLLDILLEKQIDFISGDRLSLKSREGMPFINLLGNLILSFAARVLFGSDLNDSQSGMWVFKKKIYPELNPQNNGMAFSEEIKIEAIRKKGVRFKEVPISYKERVGKKKLSLWKDGFRNLEFIFSKFFENKKISKKIIIIFLALIVFVGLAFRLALIPYGELWFDEAHSVFVAKLPLKEISGYLSNEENAPLFYFLLHYWIEWFGERDEVLKIPSVSFGILSIIIIFFLGREFFGPIAGLIAACLMAFSPLQIYYSLEVRMYSMLVFLSLASIFSLLKALKEKKPIAWFFYIIFSILGLYCHITFSFLLISQSLYFLFIYFKKEEGSDFKKWVISQALILIGYSFWLLNALKQTLIAFAYGLVYTRNWQVKTPFWDIALRYLWHSYSKWISLFSFLVIGLTCLSCFFRIDFSEGSVLIKKRKNDKFLALLLFSLLGPIFIFVFLGGTSNNIRHIIFPSVFFYLVLSGGFFRLKPKKISFAIFILVLTIMISKNLFFLKKEQVSTENNKDISSYIKAKEQDKDVILVIASWFRHEFLRYYDGSLPVLGFLPGSSAENQTSLDFAKHEIMLSGSITVSKNNVVDIENYLKPYNRVWLLYLSSTDPNHLTWFYLLENWELEKFEFFPEEFQSDFPTLSLFRRPNFFE